jgi:hypothetical protein
MAVLLVDGLRLQVPTLRPAPSPGWAHNPIALGSYRPIPALQDRPYERAGSARERTLAEDVGCARGPAVRLRIIRLQFAYLLGLRCAPAQVRRELHDLADRFAGYLRDV